MISLPRPPRSTSYLAAVVAVLCGIAQAGQAERSGTARPAHWRIARTERLRELNISLSRPVMVARKKTFLWFPTLIRLADGELLAMLNDYADETVTSPTAVVCWSGDGGLTWSEPKSTLYGDSN